MRRPPSPVLLPAYPVTGGISLMAIAVTLMTWSGKWTIDRFEMGPTAFQREPWRLVTCVLPHLDVMHLVFDVYWLWVFGTLIEEVLGHVRLLGLMFLFAAGSMAADYAFSRGGVGLSGVDFALFGMLWVLASRDRRFAEGVDRRTIELQVFWFFLCIFLTAIKVWSIANVAHGAGALLGVLVGAAMAARTPARRLMAAVGVPAMLVASLAGASVFRPMVNISRDVRQNNQIGYQAQQEGRVDDSIARYREAIAVDPKDAVAWYNLGVAYLGSNRLDDAVSAFRRAHEIDPFDSRHRHAFLRESYYAARLAQQRGDHARAIELLRGILDVDPDDGNAWAELSVSYRALGKDREAEEARSKAAQAKPTTAQP